MATMALGLDWDLALDTSNSLYAVEGAQELAQNVCTAVRVWQGEGWFDSTFGVPYTAILAYLPPQPLITAYIAQIAFTVEGVNNIDVNLEPYNKTRRVTGQILINGVTNANI